MELIINLSKKGDTRGVVNVGLHRGYTQVLPEPLQRHVLLPLLRTQRVRLCAVVEGFTAVGGGHGVGGGGGGGATTTEWIHVEREAAASRCRRGCRAGWRRLHGGLVPGMRPFSVVSVGVFWPAKTPASSEIYVISVLSKVSCC